MIFDTPGLISGHEQSAASWLPAQYLLSPFVRIHVSMAQFTVSEVNI